MIEGTVRDRWVAEVFRSPHVSAEVKVFLLHLERYSMSDDGCVSEPRDTLAAAMNCHPRKISAKFAAAVETGLLRQLARGQKGRTAVFQAVVPGGPATVQGAKNRHPETSTQGAGGRHPEDEDEDVQGASTRHPETTSPYKDRARALSNADASHPNAPQVGHASDAEVISLFDEEQDPSLRSKKRARKRAESAPTQPDLFATFWEIYPRKVAKPKAREAWDKALKKGADPELIIWGASAYASSPVRVEGGKQFTAHPASWLNAERWDDEPEELNKRAESPPPPPTRTPGHYQPYTNPADQSVYHEELRS